jgi:tetratricopeptide (TPR) repeat protein
MAVVVGLWAGGPLVAQRPPDGKPVRVPERVEREIKDALAAYSSGDDLAVERWLEPRPTALRNGLTILAGGGPNPAHVDDVLRRDPEPWTRSKAAFRLEIAWALRGRATTALSLLKSGLEMVVSRPEPVGVDPDADRFELLWIQTALGIAQNAQQILLQQELLDVIQLRARAFPRQTILQTRMPLARGIAAAGLCCWTLAPGEMVQQVRLPDRGRVTVDEAVSLFDEAAAVPALRVEALVRAAVVLQKAGRDADALARFERVPAHEDRFLGYVQHLTHGRLLDQAGRAEQAVTAYRAALRFEPASQIAATGLAAALLRTGRADDALSAAAAARKLSSETAEFTAPFRRADGRFVADWLAEIRALRK